MQVFFVNILKKQAEEPNDCGSFPRTDVERGWKTAA
jgi:hypothetical protein